MDNQHIPFGAVATDKVTKFKGIVTGYVRHLTGCDQVLIKSKSLKGKPGKGMWVDYTRVTVDPKVNGTVAEMAFTDLPPMLELGTRVRDLISGHEGTLVSVSHHVGFHEYDYYVSPDARDDDEQRGEWYIGPKLAVIEDADVIRPDEVQAEDKEAPRGADPEAMSTARM